MRGFSAVFCRELAERRMILLVGLTGLVLLVLPLFPSLSAWAGADLRPTVALVVGLLASVVLAVFLGATAIGSDLSQNRLGFYFARPLSSWAIWAGKLGAAYALALATALLVAFPSLAIDGTRTWSYLASDQPQPRLAFPNPVFTAAWFLLAWAAFVLFAVLAGHAGSIVLRSRSPVLVLDLAALTIVVSVFSSSTKRLVYAGATDPAALVFSRVLLLTFIVLGAAGATQVAAGRTDARRCHRILSLVLWAPLLVLAIAVHAYAGWVLGATPADLTGPLKVEPSPVGGWLMLRGEAVHRAGYVPAFLIDTRSGRYLRLPPSPMTRFSADGRHAVWLEREVQGQMELVTADLAATRVVPVHSRFGLNGPLRDLALSPDGARAVAITSNRLLAAELETGRLLAEMPLGFLTPLGLAFTDPSHVRFYLPKYQILDLDLTTGRPQPTGVFDAPAYPPVALSPDRRRLAFRDGAPGHLVDRVLDARTGRLLCDVPATAPDLPFFFLSGDRIAELVGGAQKTAWALAVYGPDGRELGRFPLASNVRLGGQPDAGYLVYAERGESGPWTAHLLDLSTGATRLVGRGLRPLAVEEGRLPPADLFWRHWQLVRVDLATGAERTIAGSPPDL